MPVDSKTFLKTVSHLPGIYQMRNASGQIIYVGKARNLKQRLSSYFQKNRLSPKVAVLMQQVENIQCIITANEAEALLLEANLIKEHRPRYNVLLRDDKSYPYLHLTTQHAYPRLNVYRGTRKEPGIFFGPYPNVNSVRETLNLLQRLFKIRQCSDVDFAHRSRPCLQYQIERCTAPCVNYVSEAQYQTQIKETQLFLEGRSSEIIDTLAQSMQKASEALEYEKASGLRDRIAQLRHIQTVQWVANTPEAEIDIIELLRAEEIVIGVLSVRQGQVLNQQVVFLKDILERSNAECITEFVAQYYLAVATEIPARIVVPEALPDQKILEAALSQVAKNPVHFYFGQKKAWQAWRSMLQSNLQQTLLQKITQKENNLEKLQLLQTWLQLKKPIESIECFDISHLQGTATMASCVVCGVNGMDKKAYRRFLIENIEPGDDYAAIAQAVHRRYSRLLKENKKIPDVILIDGGRGQLQKACEMLDALQIKDVAVLGIAKGEGRKPGLEKIFLLTSSLRGAEGDEAIQNDIEGSSGLFRRVASRNDELKPAVHGNGHKFPADSKILHLLQQIRDEAHRFAVSSHRKKRGKNFLRSPLEDIPGVGALRRKTLLEHFGGRQNLLQASIEEIARVPKMSLAIAKRVYAFLHENN